MVMVVARLPCLQNQKTGGCCSFLSQSLNVLGKSTPTDAVLVGNFREHSVGLKNYFVSFQK